MSGKEIGRGSGFKLADLATLEEGNTLPVGGKIIEVRKSQILSSNVWSNARLKSKIFTVARQILFLTLLYSSFQRKEGVLQ